MACLKMCLYLIETPEGFRCESSHDPHLDLQYWHLLHGIEQLAVLTPLLPVSTADFLVKEVNRLILDKQRNSIRRNGQGFFPKMVDDLLRVLKKGDSVVHVWKAAARLLQELGETGLTEPQVISIKDQGQVLLPPLRDLQSLEEVLTGRILFAHEIDKALRERGIYLEAPLENSLQILRLENRVDLLPGISVDRYGGKKCNRCGQEDKIQQVYCFTCGKESCFYCPECITMGESRSCEPLYARPRSGEDFSPANPPVIKLDVSLTKAQRAAQDEIRNFVKEKKQEKALVWAVCGAGKTEVSFSGIAEALARGDKILFAIPRKDVVIELEYRLKQAFPDSRIMTLYGGSLEKYQEADIVLATTHQTLRFYQQFDLVILDEVDAYPYHGNQMLYYVVERSRRPGGQVIYMTATPGRKLSAAAEQGEMTLVKIPARHHGYPLPEPRLIVESSLLSSDGRQILISDQVLDFLHRSVEGELAQVFVFVPSIYLAQRVGDALQQALKMPPFNDFSGNWVKYSHSRDPDRDMKRKAFSKGEFPIFVTTTIMERGITVRRANVLVLFADNEKIFDEAALIQMAGRAGRSADYPTGKVWFLGSRITPAMESARQKIMLMNKEAQRRGYLKSLAELVEG